MMRHSDGIKACRLPHLLQETIAQFTGRCLQRKPLGRSLLGDISRSQLHRYPPLLAESLHKISIGL